MKSESAGPKRVLVIAYYFPPMGLSGVQRTLKFVKYLPQFGWQPTVLTVDEVGYYAQDDTLLSELESRDIRVVRTPGAGPGRFFANKEVVKLPSERTRKWLSRVSDTFFIPDNKIGWKRAAIEKAIALHRETPFDLIFSTAPPFTSFLIGAELKERFNKPLVFDYRDPWVDYPFKFYPTPLHKIKHQTLERRALKASSHVVTTNRRVKELLINRYPFLTYHDIDIITQGFDPEDFPEGRTTPEKHEKMRLTYAGIFWEDRVPDYFLQGLHDLLQEQPALRTKIEALFVGHFREENMKTVERLGLQDVVRVVNYVPHRECIQFLLSSDVLWMIAGDDLGSPGKVYEYIGAGRPILACVPDGFMRSTILEAGGTVVEPTDTNGIKTAILAFYNQFEKKQLKGPAPDVVEKYNRVSLTGTLAKVFNEIFEP
ncbi:MAG: glycosyltransferase family 4 protein [Bacteroidota bacterium]